MAPESPDKDKPMMAVGGQKVLQPSERLYVLIFRKGERRKKIFVSQCYLIVYLLSHIRLSCDPMDSSLPDSSARGILQVRILEWVAISTSRGSSRPRDRTHISCLGRQITYL